MMASCESERIDSLELVETAKSLVKSDLTQAKVYASSALEMADSKEERFEAYFVLGYIENALGNLGSSISHYMEAIELYPENSKSVSARKNLGQIFQKLGNYDLAIYHFIQAFEFTEGKKRTEFLIMLGQAYMGNEDFQTAGEYFSLGIEESLEHEYPKLLAGLYNLEGLRQKRIGDIQKSRIYYNKVLALTDIPSYSVRAGIAYHNLGNSFLIEGDVDEAIVYFEKALELKKKSSSVFLTKMDLGECHLRKKNYKLAESYLGDAHSLYGSFTSNPDDIKIFQHLTTLNQELGRKDKALEFSNKFNSETSKYYQTRDKHLQATSIAAVKSYANLYEEGLSNKKVIKKTVYSIWAIAAGGVLSLILMIMLWLRFVRRKSKMQYELMELIEGL